MTAARLLLVCLLVAPAARAADPPKHPVPDADALKKADATVKELFKADYAKYKGPERRALVAKLLKAANAEKDPIARFALLCEARDIEVQIGDFDAAIRTLHTLAADYDLNESKELTEVIRATFKVTNLTRSDLAILAAGEIAKPTESKPALDLAESWVLYAGQEKGRVKSLFQGRAVRWYAVAAADVGGLARKEIENKKMKLIATIESADDKAGRWTLWEGKWEGKYANGHVRSLEVATDGQISSPEERLTGRLMRNRDGVHLRFSNGQMDVLHMLGDEIDIDHFNPARDYPKKLTLKGTTARVR